jgi:hypothetical protein
MTPVPPLGSTNAPNKPPTELAPILKTSSEAITTGPSGDFVIGTQTVSKGGSAVVQSTTVVIATDGSVAVVNGQTSTLAATPALYTGPLASGDAARVSLSGVAIGLLGVLPLWL